MLIDTVEKLQSIKPSLLACTDPTVDTETTGLSIFQIRPSKFGGSFNCVAGRLRESKVAVNMVAQDSGNGQRMQSRRRRVLWMSRNRWKFLLTSKKGG
jgi:hypothetical protein